MNGAEYKILEEKLNTIDTKIGHVEGMVKDQKDKVCDAINKLGKIENEFAGRYETCPNVRLVNKHEVELGRITGIKQFLAWLIPVSLTVISGIVGLIVFLIAG